jgi:hypothetical protein
MQGAHIAIPMRVRSASGWVTVISAQAQAKSTTPGREQAGQQFLRQVLGEIACAFDTLEQAAHDLKVAQVYGSKPVRVRVRVSMVAC